MADTKPKGLTRPNRPEHMRMRRGIKKEAERAHGFQAMAWHGGVLYFVATLTPVPDVPHVPKPGNRAIGLDGAQPKPTPKRDPYTPPSRSNRAGGWREFSFR